MTKESEFKNWLEQGGANSLWRKSRIRLGPGAIEPVH